MTDEILTVTARFRVKAGEEQRVLDAAAEMVEAVRREEGCLGYDLYQAADDPALFLVFEHWQSKEALDRHSVAPHMREFGDAVGGAMDGATEIALWSRSL
jgi:quinol monooxygenase YgiN